MGSMLLTFDTCFVRSGFGLLLEALEDLLGTGTTAFPDGTSSRERDLDPFVPFARATFTALSTSEAVSLRFDPTVCATLARHRTRIVHGKSQSGISNYTCARIQTRRKTILNWLPNRRNTYLNSSIASPS